MFLKIEKFWKYIIFAIEQIKIFTLDIQKNNNFVIAVS